MNAGDSCALTPPASENVLDDATVDMILASLFGASPPPHVMAAGQSGLCVPMPSELPLPAEHIITGIGSALELCIPADLRPIVDAWERARKNRASQVAIHLRSNPERTVRLHFIDARQRFGVYFGIVVGMDGGLPGADVQAPLFRPKIFTLHRTELSVISQVDDATSKVLGWDAQALLGTKILELTHPDDKPGAIANWMAMLGRPGGENRYTMRVRHHDGHYLWFEVTHHNWLGDPAHGYVKSDFLDISERMEAVEALRASEELLRRLTEALPLGVVQIGTDRSIVYRNERLSAIVGVTGAATLDELLRNVMKADRRMLEDALAAVLTTGDSSDIELSLACDTLHRQCSVGMRALRTESGAVAGAIVCIADITERVRLREELELRAKFDTLTRCHNRASVLEELEGLLAAPKPSPIGLAVMFVDLDRFKAVNDRYGHAAGDELLRVTGQRLLAFVREGDIVGRLGGDEFLVVCGQVTSGNQALEIAHRLAAVIAQAITVAHATIVPGSSIGVAWTNGPIDVDALVASADAAMYESKRGDHAPVLHIATPTPAAGVA